MDHFEGRTWLWRFLLTSAPAANDRVVSGLRPRLLHDIGDSALMAREVSVPRL